MVQGLSRVQTVFSSVYYDYQFLSTSCIGLTIWFHNQLPNKLWQQRHTQNNKKFEQSSQDAQKPIEFPV